MISSHTQIRNTPTGLAISLVEPPLRALLDRVVGIISK